MKIYYYLEGDVQKGPYTHSEIEGLQLNTSVLMWKQGMKNWTSKEKFLEFNNEIATALPPIPIEEKVNKNSQNNITSFIMIVWISFNLFALWASHSEIKIFNWFGDRDTSEFWPFVNYYENNLHYLDGSIYVLRFGGIFTNYDWTEFSFYVGLPLIILTISKVIFKK